MPAEFGTISTHILDMVTGEPARGVPVRLDRRDDDGGWRPVGQGHTDGDGRLRYEVPAPDWRPGGFRLVFEVGSYLGDGAFFPEVTVAFQLGDTGRHYHVPLLLSRFGYTTYRGS